MTKKLTKRRAALVAAMVGCTTLAVVGIGAVTTLETSVDNNRVTIAGPDPTASPDPTPEPTPVAKIVTASTPFDETFAAAGDSFEHDFTVTNEGDAAATWDGNFTNIALSNPDLAPHIRIEYRGYHRDGSPSYSWTDGGTIESPRSYSAGLKSMAQYGVAVLGDLPAGETHTTRVRLTMAVDPADFGATESNPATLTLDWAVGYTAAE